MCHANLTIWNVCHSVNVAAGITRFPGSVQYDFNLFPEYNMSDLEFWYHHVGVSVPDIDAAIAWYDRVLEFKMVRRFRIEAIPAEIAILKHGALHVELFQPDNATPLPPQRRDPDSDARLHGNKHISFAVDDVPLFAEALQRRGAELVWLKRHANGANMFIRDNAGNLIEFLQAPREKDFVISLAAK